MLLQRLRALAALPLVLSAVALGAPDGRAAAAPPPDQPNIVVLLLDDATRADVAQMPAVQRLLADEGVTFTRNYTPFPHCCPARATILTGLYPHNHHVLDINPPYGGFGRFDDQHTIATYLDDDYRTGMVGKYMNKFDAASEVSPGWDFFQVPVRGVYHYLAQQQMSVDGSLADVAGYMPRVHADQAMDFISSEPPGEQPWFAYLGWVAPHTGSPSDRRREPASPYVVRRLRGSYAGERLPASAAYDERRVGDKRAAIRERPRITRKVERQIAYVRGQRRESLVAVDRKVAQLVDLVESRGELDDTYFVLTSDNGWMEGQHRIPSGKLQAYEESAGVPLIIRGPGFEPGTRYDGVTGLQDLVPTFLDLAGVPLPPGAPEPDGVSLRDLVSGDLVTDRPQVIEIAENSRTKGGRIAVDDPPWLAQGIVTPEGWKYVDYPGTGEVEMYSLRDDPDELRNLAGKTRWQAEELRLSAMLDAYRGCGGADCRS